jgi:acyl-coenzyme A thioesterase PaaI-like protein
MQLYPPARTLSGGALFYAYDAAAVAAVLACLVPTNMLLLVAARSFEGHTDREERW